MFIKNIIIQKESDSSISQWQLDQKSIFIIAFSAVIIFSVTIFLISSLIGSIVYNKKINEYKSSYDYVSENLSFLSKKMNKLNNQIKLIEEKDLALRTYAGMPQIDINMRKLGIGGEKLETSRFLNGMAPIINKELAVLEMDIEKLSREVNFEMKSYKSIYDEVQKNIQRIVRIPSIKPVDGGFLNSTFGYRNDPIDNVKRFHHGQDITVKSGTPIYSPADGEIKRAYYVGGFGNHIKIDHGLGYTTLFAHLSKLKVKHGQKVKRGEVIGLTGNTGRSTAPHLHYEIHYNGEPQNPLDYFFSDNSN
ncbi:M23 family metallopeptidase [Candidatus Marinimicrobia bacterium]|jgi:murein DD-endopeptidase MepM/ murein hydrolase activator NlpD|nr:M23 family metallopeptidase [Candidatus Neomarinimicrobiota bacterium]